MKRKISKDQLELPLMGQGANAIQHFTRWHDTRLKAETNWLYNIATTARAEFERYAPDKSRIEEIADIKHSQWGEWRGEMFSVAQAKATLKFLRRFRADQNERIARLRQFCTELNERGIDTSEIDTFINLEK